MSIRRHLTYANVAATLALTLALGGTGAYAATLVTSKQIKNGTIRNVDLHNGTIRANKINASAKVRLFSGATSGSVNLATTSTVLDVAVPSAGHYVISAKTILANNEGLTGVPVTCTLYGAGSPVDASVTNLELDATIGSPNASTDTISLLGTQIFTGAGTVELTCDSGGSHVVAADAVITAIRIP